MKKLITFMLALSMAASMAACGNSKENTDVNSLQDQSPDTEMVTTDHTISSEMDVENSITITMDNWDTYFELKRIEDPFINESGKTENWDFLYAVFLKPEYSKQYNYGSVDFELSYDLVSYECMFDEYKITLGNQTGRIEEGQTATFGLEDFRDHAEINKNSPFFNTVAGIVYGGSTMEQDNGTLSASVPENGKILHAEGFLVMK